MRVPIPGMSNFTQRETELENSLSVIAYVIAHHGNGFWPVYTLVENELELLRERQNKISASLSKLPNQRSISILERV